MIATETWTWECVGAHQGPAFLGVWQAQAYIAERAQGWYAAAEGHHTGAEYVYRLPGRLSPSGPYTRIEAERTALLMIGLAADASRPDPEQLVLYQPAAELRGREHTAQDVTGGRWTLASSKSAHRCMVCSHDITSGWTEGPWQHARRFVCDSHVLVLHEARPAHGLNPAAHPRRGSSRVSAGVEASHALGDGA